MFIPQFALKQTMSPRFGLKKMYLNRLMINLSESLNVGSMLLPLTTNRDLDSKLKINSIKQ